jgi:hypothetical protein
MHSNINSINHETALIFEKLYTFAEHTKFKENQKLFQERQAKKIRDRPPDNGREQEDVTDRRGIYREC